MPEVQSWETVPRQPEDPPLTSLRLIIWFKPPPPAPAFVWSQGKKLRTKNLPTATRAIRRMGARGRFPSESFPFPKTNAWRCQQRGLDKGTQGSRNFLWRRQAILATSLRSLSYPEIKGVPNLQIETQRCKELALGHTRCLLPGAWTSHHLRGLNKLWHLWPVF